MKPLCDHCGVRRSKVWYDMNAEQAEWLGVKRLRSCGACGMENAIPDKAYLETVREARRQRMAGHRVGLHHKGAGAYQVVRIG